MVTVLTPGFIRAVPTGFWLELEELLLLLLPPQAASADAAPAIAATVATGRAQATLTNVSPPSKAPALAACRRVLTGQAARKPAAARRRG
jgi:hypothetical protein